MKTRTLQGVVAWCVWSALSACGGGAAVPDATPKVELKPALKATKLLGPFADVAAFCKQLGHPACEEDSRTMIVISKAREVKTIGAGGQAQLITVASRDASAQYAHALVRRGEQLWALAPLLSYDASDQRQEQITIMRFEVDEKQDTIVNLRLNLGLEQEPGGEAEVEEHSYYCQLKEGVTPSCVMVMEVTARVEELMVAKIIEAGSVMAILEAGPQLEIRSTTFDRITAQRQAKLLAQGVYPISF